MGTFALISPSAGEHAVIGKRTIVVIMEGGWQIQADQKTRRGCIRKDLRWSKR